MLATVGSAVALTAGCLDSTNGDDPNTDGDGPGASPGSPTTDPGPDTPTNDPATPTTPVADLECPTFEKDVDRRVCWPDRDGDAETLSIEASSPVLERNADEGEVATLTFTLGNVTGRPFGMNPYAWSIHRWTGDAWEKVAPDAHVEPWTTVESGESYEWVLSTREHSGPQSENSQAIVEDLADGTYAFQIAGNLAAESADGTETATATAPGDDADRVECVALFAVEQQG
jgi:hypothetical protein